VGPSDGDSEGAPVGDGQGVELGQTVVGPLFAVGVAVAVPQAPATTTAISAAPAPRSLFSPPCPGAGNRFLSRSHPANMVALFSD
jgi:hypothetical protein